MRTEVKNAASAKIETKEDVRDFFSFLIHDMHLNFHPDDGMADYIDNSGGEFFTEEEAEVLEIQMENCWMACTQNNYDIYEIALEITNLD